MDELLEWKDRIEQMNSDQLEALGLLVAVRRRQFSAAHRLELTRMLDDGDHTNWMDDADIFEALGSLNNSEYRELLNFLIILGENDHPRGIFVEKDYRGRDIQVAIAGRSVVYYYVEDDSNVVRILRVTPSRGYRPRLPTGLALGEAMGPGAAHGQAVRSAAH
ncbi:MAG: hypothetical protein ACFB21_09215 [Opitutales bacterium]